MRARIKVTDLTIEQWMWLCSNLPEAREFSPGSIRMCVELELTGQADPIHVEMPPREFVTLIEKVSQVEEGETFSVETAGSSAPITTYGPGTETLTEAGGCLVDLISGWCTTHRRYEG